MGQVLSFFRSPLPILTVQDLIRRGDEYFSNGNLTLSRIYYNFALKLLPETDNETINNIKVQLFKADCEEQFLQKGKDLAQSDNNKIDINNVVADVFDIVMRERRNNEEFIDSSELHHYLLDLIFRLMNIALNEKTFAPLNRQNVCHLFGNGQWVIKAIDNPSSKIQAFSDFLIHLASIYLDDSRDAEYKILSLKDSKRFEILKKHYPDGIVKVTAQPEERDSKDEAIEAKKTADYYRQLNKYSEACAYYRLALQLDPDCPMANLSLVATKIEQDKRGSIFRLMSRDCPRKQTDTVIDILKRFNLNQKFTTAQEYEYLGYILTEFSELVRNATQYLTNAEKILINDLKKEAIECFTKAIEIDPTNPHYYYQRAFTRNAFERLFDQEVISDLKKYVELAAPDAPHMTEVRELLDNKQQAPSSPGPTRR